MPERYLRLYENGLLSILNSSKNSSLANDRLLWLSRITQALMAIALEPLVYIFTRHIFEHERLHWPGPHISVQLVLTTALLEWSSPSPLSSCDGEGALAAWGNGPVYMAASCRCCRIQRTSQKTCILWQGKKPKHSIWNIFLSPWGRPFYHRAICFWMFCIFSKGCGLLCYRQFLLVSSLTAHTSVLCTEMGLLVCKLLTMCFVGIVALLWCISLDRFASLYKELHKITEILKVRKFLLGPFVLNTVPKALPKVAC